VAAEASAPYPVSYPRPGWAEQDAEEWWRAVCLAARKTLEISGADSAQIIGVGVDGQSWSAVPVDRLGRSLCPTPIWMDTRAADVCARLAREIGGERIFGVSGNPLSPSYSLPKILWMRENRPEVYEKTACFLQSNSFIVYRLTGALTQDLSQCYAFACFDMRKAAFDAEIAGEMGFDLSLIPEAVLSHQAVGKVTKEAAAQCGLAEGTPVAAGGLDAACATLGCGVVRAGQTQEQGGQASGMSICMEKYHADPRLILGCHVVPGQWLLQGGSVGGGSLKWLRDSLFPDLTFEEMSRMAETVPAGSDGLVFLPYMAGERSPVWDPAAKGAFFGLDFAKTRAHMARAVMEGVAFSLRHNLETAANAGAEVSVMNAVGGAANSLVWTQIKADVTGKPIEVPSSDTAGTLGAAMLAGVAAGVWGGFGEAAAKTVRITRRHQPDGKNRSVYDRQYRVYRELYEDTKGLGR